MQAMPGICMWLGGVVLLVGIFAILYEQESKKEQANEETSYRSALVPEPAPLFALDPQAFCLPGRMSLLGTYNFNCIPVVPSGICILVHDKPLTCGTAWSSHAL
jgi:hypothetical protein